MKILGRIIIILIAALAVIGAATALAGNSNSLFPDGERESRSFRQDQPSDFSTGSESIQPLDYHDRFHEGDRDGPSLFGIVGVIQSLVIVSIIVVLVTLEPRLKGVLARLTASFHNI